MYDKSAGLANCALPQAPMEDNVNTKLSRIAGLAYDLRNLSDEINTKFCSEPQPNLKGDTKQAPYDVFSHLSDIEGNLAYTFNRLAEASKRIG